MCKTILCSQHARTGKKSEIKRRYRFSCKNHKCCIWKFFFSFHELMQFIHSSKKFCIKLVAQILHLKSLLFSFTEALCMFIQNTFLWKTSIAKVSLEGLFWFMNRRNMFFYFGIFAKLASQFLYLRSLIILWNDATYVFMLLFSAKLVSHFFLFVYYVFKFSEWWWSNDKYHLFIKLKRTFFTK